MAKTEASFQQLDFEKALAELKNVVKDMEKDDLTLNAALSCYEKGVRLTHHCQDLLNHAEQKVRQLMQDKNQEWLTAFTTDHDNTNSNSDQ